MRISAAVLRGWRTIGSARQGKTPAAADVMKQMLALYVAGFSTTSISSRVRVSIQPFVFGFGGNSQTPLLGGLT